MTDRLTKEDWIALGLRTLAKEGVGGLKVGPLAEKLKVSRGSFYWHFADMADFRGQLLAAWQARETDAVIAEVDEAAPPGRLRTLFRRAFQVKRPLDQAIRVWAREDREVAAAVAATDTRRVAYIVRILMAAGVPEGRAQARATFAYWAYLGHSAVVHARHGQIAAPVLDEICDRLEQP
jgi:AcrR family transcriptional regulator